MSRPAAPPAARRAPATGDAASAPDTTLADDVALVTATLAGDREAFGQLVRRHLTAARSAALAVLADPSDAEDVCQDAFLTALERLEECRPAAKFRPWLLVIVRNRAVDLLRRQRVRRAESLDLPPESTPPEVARLATRDPGPARAAERADLRAHLRAALATLTPSRREVVLLHDLAGWSHREIATHLGVAEGTVRAHLFWARRALRERLGAIWRRGAEDDR